MNCSPSSSIQSFALLLYVGLRDWTKVLELLLSSRRVATAAHLVNLLRRLLPADLERMTAEEEELRRLVDGIYGEYANELASLGLHKAALHYCRFAGDRKVSLEQQIRLLMDT